MKNLLTGQENTWCPGCGHFAGLSAIHKVIEESDIPQENFVLTYDIGCSSNIAGYTKVYTLKTLHGRSVIAGAGVHLANQKLKVISFAGDGGTMCEAPNHLIHCARHNFDMTFIMQNNQIFGLTTGQSTATSQKSAKTSSQPYGTVSRPLNPSLLVLTSGGTFIARVFSNETAKVLDSVRRAINHRGFSFVEILQPCVTFAPTAFQEALKLKKDLPENYNAKSYEEAFKYLSDKSAIYSGIFYINEEEKTYIDNIYYENKGENLLDVKPVDISHLAKELFY